GVTHSKEEGEESFCLGQFRRSVGLQTGGSILQVMEDSSSGLVEVPLGGCAFTWCHKSDSKMSKLDRFLISKGIMGFCPNITSITLDRYLFDHRPIILREIIVDTWSNMSISDTNAISKFMKKLRHLKLQTRSWIMDKKESATTKKAQLKGMLKDIDILIDEKKVDQELLNKRMDVINSIHGLEKFEATEIAQKAKIKWSIEGDENSNFFHGILNKKRNQHAIHGILSEGNWTEDPNSVKNAFFSHFKERFDSPCSSRLMLEEEFLNKLRADQSIDLVM
nr:RNA-directed DNA polymerase, eukaryota, reverse transcriptase zinc-binding domain protein [Tanacetum cinerariifolium]